MNNIARRRYEVFVGSTFRELKEARQQIIEAILLTGHIPCGTELWPAEPQAPIGVINDYLYPCDIHVLIIGYRYGSLVPNKPISFTHWEYLQSKGNKPLLVFMQEDSEVENCRAEIRKKFPDDPDLKNEEKFQEFRADLKKGEHSMLVHFTMANCGIPKLAGDCIAALGRLTTFGLASGQLSPSSGWIRADSHEGETLIAIEGNPFLKRVMDQVRQFEVLAKRLTKTVEAKKAMARYFWFYMQWRVRDWAKRNQPKKQAKKSENGGAANVDLNLFFESGSTLAYVALEFEQAVLNEAGVHEDWHIRTNNILCLLQFELHTPLDGRRFPDGKPDPRDKYGAIFPQKWGVLHREPPKRPRAKLSHEEEDAVSDLRVEFCPSGHGPTLVLATASGWDTDNLELSFRGPHVGSHKNMLFKRVIFTSKNPVVLFLDAEKLGFRCQDNCYPIFDREFPVEKWIKNFPVALCIGWETQNSPDRQKGRPSEKAAQIKKLLIEIGFQNEFFLDEKAEGEKLVGAILMANDKFTREIPLLDS